MQFSILGVPFRCTKDMFTWTKIKESICVYWALAWRGALMGVAAVFLFLGILLIPSFWSSEALSSFSTAEFDVKLSMYLVYCLQYWYQQMFVLGIIVLALLCVSLILGVCYVQYYGIFKKNYRSFERQYNKPQVQSFLSSGYWKPLIFTVVFGWAIGFSSEKALEILGLEETLRAIFNIIVGAGLFHIFFQGGTWGFVTAPKNSQHLER